MGKMISKSIMRMGWKAKALLLSLLTVLVTFGMLKGWNPGDIQADVVVQQAWGTPLYNAAASPGNLSFTVTAGTNRVLVVAVTSAINAASTTQSCSVTYGGVPLTMAVSDQTSNAQQHSWLFYLPDNAIMDGTAKTLAVTTGNGGRTFVNNMVYAAVYSGVDQGSPLVDSKSYNSGATLVSAPAFATALNTAAGGKAVVVANAVRTTATTTTTMTAAANWTLTRTATWTTTYGIRTGVLDRAVPATAATDTAPVTFQAARTALASMCGLSLRAAPTTSSLTVSGNTAIATGTRLDSDTGVIMQRLQVAASGDLTLNSITMENTGSATAIQNAYVYISGSSQTTLPGDAVLLAQVNNWSGLSTPIDLTAIGGTAAARGITAATPKYLYIVADMAPGQATKTVATRVTAVGVVSPNTGASALDLRSNIITLNYSGNVAQVTGNTAVAASAKDSDAAVLMQHFQVASDAGFDGALELSSLTIEDLGNVSQVDAVKIYVDTVEQPVLPASAKLIGTITGWNRAKVTIPLVDDFGATSADRTVISGTPKHLYVVYSMNYVDDALWPTTGKVVQSKVSAVGVSSPDSGPTGLSLLSNSITLTRGTWSKITSCGGCHATDVSGPNALQDGTARNVPQGQFPGSHGKHLAAGLACSSCHNVPSVYGHANNLVELGGQAAGTVYSKGASFAVSNTPVMGNCSNIYCHSNGTNTSGTPAAPSQTATWGTPFASCNGCHGGSNTNGLPNYVNGTPRANSHAAHASYNCSVCHYGTTTDGSSITGNGNHANGVYNIGNQAGTISYSMGAVTNGIPAGGTCSSAAGCHNSATWGTTLTCSSCHLTTAADVFDWTYGNGTTGNINSDQWSFSGHGKTSGTYTVTGSAAANFPGAAGAGGNPCLYCHDETVVHTSSSNPIRLRNFAHVTYGKNGVCLACHATGATGVDPDGAGSMANKGATKKIDKNHYGSQHAASLSGGQFCWDCHNPHGDTIGTDPIAMFRKRPVLVSNSTTGVPTTVATADITFTGRTLASNYMATAAPFNTKICNVCHTYKAADPNKMVHYTNTSSDGHQSGTLCTNCHKHSSDTTLNGNAFEGSGDCNSCHNAPVGDRRQVTGAAGDFVRASRHVSNGTLTEIVTKWDCILCHQEGDAATGKTSGLHTGTASSKADVNLRNVDSYGTGWPWNRFAIKDVVGAPYTMTAAQKTAMHDNMDSFCMGCHDANGASQIAVNSGNNGVDTVTTGSVARALKPFNTADNLRGNTTDAATLGTHRSTTYGRVLNVKDQFNSTNRGGTGNGLRSDWASHHNLNQFVKRYGTRNTTTFPTAIFTAYVTKEGKTLNSTSTVAGESGETVGLHCSDCHLNEVNAHGAANSRFMLASGTTDADVAWTGTAAGTTNPCYRCHAIATYNGGTTGRFDHSDDSSRTLATMGSPLGNICFNCHGGYSSRPEGALGAIHGTNEDYNPGGSSATSKRYRFMSGATMRFYRPAAKGTTAVSSTTWGAASTSNSCYTTSAADTWNTGGCNQHSAGVGQGTGTINYTKPLDW